MWMASVMVNPMESWRADLRMPLMVRATVHAREIPTIDAPQMEEGKGTGMASVKAYPTVSLMDDLTMPLMGRATAHGREIPKIVAPQFRKETEMMW